MCCDCGSMSTLDAVSAVRHGVLQMSAGILSVQFDLAALLVSILASPHSPPPGLSHILGVVFIAAGSLTLLAGVKRSSVRLAAAALTLQIFNVLAATINLFFASQSFVSSRRNWHCYLPRDEIKDCVDWPYPIFVFVCVVVVVLAFSLVVSGLCCVVRLSVALHRHRLGTTATTRGDQPAMNYARLEEQLAQASGAAGEMQPPEEGGMTI